MVAVAVAAIPFAVWSTWLSPARRWQRAIFDAEDEARRWEAMARIWNGGGAVEEATALATLVEASRSPDRRVRVTAVTGLGRFGPKARPHADRLIGALADPDEEVRRLAAQALVQVLPSAEAKREDAVAALLQRLDDPSRRVREQVAFALAEFGRGDDALPVLLEALRQSDNTAPATALDAIGRIGPLAAERAMPEVKALEARLAPLQVPNLRRLLKVSAAAARARMGDPDGLATLDALARSTDVDLAGEARRVRSEEGFPAPPPP